MRMGTDWYQGTADSVYQNLYLIERHRPEISGGLRRRPYLSNEHPPDDRRAPEKNAEATVAALPVRIEEAAQFGVIEVDDDWRIVGFEEKPSQPKSIPGEPDYALVSMGNYLFNTDVLIAGAHARTPRYESSAHDFGRDILPDLYSRQEEFSPTIFAKTACHRRKRARSPATGVISEPSKLTTKLIWIFAPWIHRSIYTIAAGRCEPSDFGDPPAKFVFDWYDRKGMALEFHRLRRNHHQRQLGAKLRRRPQCENS